MMRGTETELPVRQKGRGGYLNIFGALSKAPH